MKTIFLSALALGLLAAPALAENATNDPFGGRAPFFAMQPAGPVATGVDFTATAAIPEPSSQITASGERAEDVYNRFNR